MEKEGKKECSNIMRILFGCDWLKCFPQAGTLIAQLKKNEIADVIKSFVMIYDNNRAWREGLSMRHMEKLFPNLILKLRKFKALDIQVS